MNLGLRAFLLRVVIAIVSGAFVTFGSFGALGALGAPADYPIAPVPFNQVEFTDTFWRPRLATQRETLVPFALDQTKSGVAHLQAAADYLAGKDVKNHRPHRYIDSDLYKVMEGAAYLLHLKRDPELEARMDGIIAVIAAAQETDGYLYPSHTTKVGNAKLMMGDKPYSYELHSHELYNVGHLYEAAVAYYQATGKDTLLNVAEKSATHINRVFFVGDPRYNDGKPVMQAPGHEEIELALARLYRATGKPLYLEMARRFVEIRGVTYRPDGKGVDAPTYAQQHAPVKEQRQAVGHAVRAAYLYSGMADVSALTGDRSYVQALDAIWNDIVDTRMHITGGLGAIHGIEGFGPHFDLPNAEAYDETCAAVGNVFLNYRMFLLSGDAKYLDVAEVALLNNVLAGVNLEGNRFFYVNPLESDGIKPFNHGTPSRAPWFGTACCPSNLARLVPQVPGMTYAHRARELYVTFYAGSRARVPLDGVSVDIRQDTRYPDDGRISLAIDPEQPARFSVRLRVPTWTRDRFVPGALYRYASVSAEKFTLRVNGETIAPAMERGFAVIEREWKRGDRVELNLPMPVLASVCRPEVEANLNRVAFTRGPLLLCSEGLDNQGAVQRVHFETLPQTQPSPSRIEIPRLGSFLSVSLPAQAVTEDDRVERFNVTLIPYYAWNNRGPSSMIVWFPRERSQAIFDPAALPKLSPFAELKASTTQSGDSVNAVSDLHQPRSSADKRMPRWRSRNPRGQEQWVEGVFAGARRLRGLGVYWCEDAGNNVLRPESWSAEARQNGQWLPLRLYAADDYSLRLDQFNVIHPAAEVDCDAIRIRMKPPAYGSVGILEVSMEFGKPPF